MESLKYKEYEGIPLVYRPGTSDENILQEVLERKCYRRPSFGFDVEAGETWLDLGANIGAFAVYCKTVGATAICYEPDPDCFAILRRNAVDFRCINRAVSCKKDSRVSFFQSSASGKYARGSLLEYRGSKQHRTVENLWAGELKKQFYFVQVIKMDIEGSEFGILDEDLLPKCEKLVLEYHTSRDPSVDNLRRRLEKLHRRFREVRYPPEYDRLLREGNSAKTYFDRLIFCKGAQR